jgi:hypothetical protein
MSASASIYMMTRASSRGRVESLSLGLLTKRAGLKDFASKAEAKLKEWDYKATRAIPKWVDLPNVSDRQFASNLQQYAYDELHLPEFIARPGPNPAFGFDPESGHPAIEFSTRNPFAVGHELEHFVALHKKYKKRHPGPFNPEKMRRMYDNEGEDAPESGLSKAVSLGSLAGSAALPAFGVDDELARYGIMYGAPLAAHAPKFLDEFMASILALKHAKHLGSKDLSLGSHIKGWVGLGAGLGRHSAGAVYRALRNHAVNLGMPAGDG